IRTSATSPTDIPALPPRTSTVNSTSAAPSCEMPIAERALICAYQDLVLEYNSVFRICKLCAFNSRQPTNCTKYRTPVQNRYKDGHAADCIVASAERNNSSN